MEAEFITSAPDLKSRPEPVLPEFAFLGRSNCGKSSLINHFLGRVNLAKVGGTPGKTRFLNYFLVNGAFYLVDLPGYGYAKVSKTIRAQWKTLYRSYLQSQDRPLAIFQLLDARHQPTADDLEIFEWIRDSGHPFAIAATKIDKIGTNGRMRRFQEIITALDLPGDIPFFPTSAAQKTGRKEMLAWVAAILEANADSG